MFGILSTYRVNNGNFFQMELCFGIGFHREKEIIPKKLCFIKNKHKTLRLFTNIRQCFLPLCFLEKLFKRIEQTCNLLIFKRKILKIP